MSFTLQAIAGTRDVLTPVVDGFAVVDLPQGNILVPLVASVLERFGIPQSPLTDDGISRTPESLAVFCRRLSAFGAVAYLEAELWAGEGRQAAVVASHGAIVHVFLDDQAINRALAVLGVTKGDARDEFDALGLGAYRETEAWLSAAAQPAG